jgi:hypothetical protein
MPPQGGYRPPAPPSALRGGGRRLPPPKPSFDWRGPLRHLGVVVGVLAALAALVLVVVVVRKAPWRSRARAVDPATIEAPKQLLVRVTQLRQRKVTELESAFEYDVALPDGTTDRITLGHEYPAGTRLRLLCAKAARGGYVVYSHSAIPTAAP